MRRWVELIEARIAATPSQWLNVHPVWDASGPAEDTTDDRTAA